MSDASRTDRLPRVGDIRKIRPGSGLVGSARILAVDEKTGAVHVSVKWGLEEADASATTDLTAATEH